MMDQSKILIVDDERNIRLSLSQTLKPLGWPVDTAVNGEEALSKLADQEIGLMILDIKMPGMDGLMVLAKASELRPDVKIIMVTAYGTVERAVEAMRLGAVDFIQKPFSPEEIRELIEKVIDRDRLKEEEAKDYQSRLELAKRSISQRNFRAALVHAQKAISLDPHRAEGFNLVGAIYEILHESEQALKNYHMAYEADPTYSPALTNIDRLVSHRGHGPIAIEPEVKAGKH